MTSEEPMPHQGITRLRPAVGEGLNIRVGEVVKDGLNRQYLQPFFKTAFILWNNEAVVYYCNL
jgi:hypothetical protein